MKEITIILVILLSKTLAFGQYNSPIKFAEYDSLKNQADSLIIEKDFKNAAITYSEAFEIFGYRSNTYDAACAWALASKPDSAFECLNKLVKSNYFPFWIWKRRLKTDSRLSSLHNDNRWKPLLEVIRQKKKISKARLNKPLIRILKDIEKDDQKYRKKIDRIEKRHGFESEQKKDILKSIHLTDSINLIKVKSIIDQYGWLGVDEVGYRGNATLFLVIQHSDSATRVKYLPIMREAVRNDKADVSDLALLEDRVALEQGKRQIYGSQIGKNPETKLYYVLPLDDPENVDKRRRMVGLMPMASYVLCWNIIWDVEQYKKDLPKIEELRKKK